MFRNDGNGYEVINGENIDDELMAMAKDLDLNQESSFSNKWFLFSVYYALSRNLDIVTAKSFGDVITYFMANVKLDNVGKFFKKDQIIDDINEIIYEAYDLDEDNIENVKSLFADIFVIYDELIEKYTYKTEQLLIRVSIPTKHKFNCVDGDTASERLDKLLVCYENNCNNL